MATWGALNNANTAGDSLLNGLAVFGGAAAFPGGTITSVHPYTRSEGSGGNWRMCLVQGSALNGASRIWDSGTLNNNFGGTPGFQQINTGGVLGTATNIWLGMKSDLSQYYYLCALADCGDVDDAFTFYTSSGGMNPSDPTIAFPATVSADPDGSSGPGLKFFITYTAAGGSVATIANFYRRLRAS